MAIGALFIAPATTWWAVGLMIPQMAGTFLPLITLPRETYSAFPWALTIEGQYIVKNLALIALAVFVAGRRSLPARSQPTGKYAQ